MALGLGRSLALIGDPTPRAVYTDLHGPWDRYFDRVIRPTEGRSALDKLRAFELTDADAVLAVDGDMLAFRPVGPILDEMRGTPFAVQGDAHSEGRWHGADVAALCRRFGRPHIPRFNGGLLYYERNPEFTTLLERMREVERDFDRHGFEAFRGKPSEEVCILLAMLETGLGAVVPDRRDYQGTAVGLIGKLHLDVRTNTCEYLARRERVRFVRPYLFHASRYSAFAAYWRNLEWLEKLDA